jgi:hypothetical protein
LAYPGVSTHGLFGELINIGLTLKKAMFAIRGMSAAIEKYLQTDGKQMGPS